MKNAEGLIGNIILMAMICIATINIIRFIGGMAENIEWILTLLLISVSVLLAYSVFTEKKWAWPSLLVFYSINLLNSAAIFYASGMSFSVFVIAVSSIAGFSASMAMGGKCEKLQESYEKITPIEIYEQQPENSYIEISTETSGQGKYVASKGGARYHTPKCDWAFKINEKNKVWYKTRREAEKAGKDACECTN